MQRKQLGGDPSLKHVSVTSMPLKAGPLSYHPSTLLATEEDMFHFLPEVHMLGHWAVLRLGSCPADTEICPT